MLERFLVKRLKQPAECEVPTKSIKPNFAAITAGIVILIVYGSLFPFRFDTHVPNDPGRALLATWRTPTGRGDFLANLLLYFPFGLFIIATLRRLPKSVCIALATLAGSALSVSLELAQFYDEGRQSAMADVYSNTAGALLGGAAGAVLFSRRLPQLVPSIRRRPFVILLLCSWLGYRLVPFVPTIDLHKYWAALKPLVLSPTLPLIDLYRHAVTVLVVAILIEALFDARNRVALPLVVLGVLVARVFIIDIVLSPAEVVGGTLGAIAWGTLLWRARLRIQLVTVLFVGVIVIQALAPFQFSSLARPFGWIPFLGFMQGSLAVNVASFFEKAFTYGALLWLAIRAGLKFAAAVELSTGLVFGLRLAQVFLPGRSAEITDAIMVLMMAAAMKMMGEEDPVPSSLDGKTDTRRNAR